MYDPDAPFELEDSYSVSEIRCRQCDCFLGWMNIDTDGNQKSTTPNRFFTSRELTNVLTMFTMKFCCDL
jgi:hypothetical protein